MGRTPREDAYSPKSKSTFPNYSAKAGPLWLVLDRDQPRVGALITGHTRRAGACWARAGVWRSHKEPALAWT